MKILITGATGLIGSALIKTLGQDHQLIALSRQPRTSFSTPKNLLWYTSLDDIDFNQVDAVINLAGEPIADKRWSNSQKSKICQSRWQLTKQLVNKIEHAVSPPKVFISGSAIGIYGRQTDKQITENFNDHYPEFSHTICQQWENIALLAKNERVRVALLRTGIVLAPHGGALAKMLPAFRFGFGGKMGSGHQFMSWIHIDDMVNAIIHILYTPSLSGAINCTAPSPVTNEQFSQQLASHLNRPCICHLPTWMLRLLFGEMADLLVYGQQVLPDKLASQQFKFKFTALEQALTDLIPR